MIRGAVRSGLVGSYQPLPWVGIHDAKRAIASERRWELMDPHLPQSCFSALDIGCNNGYFALKLAERGALALGIDTSKPSIWVANRVKECAGISGAAFAHYELTPESVGAVAQYDVILNLSVFHNIAHFQGFEASREILEALIQRTRQVMFFETGENSKEATGHEATGYTASMPDMGPDPEVWIRSFLLDCGASEVSRLGEAPTTGEIGSRGLYAVR